MIFRKEPGNRSLWLAAVALLAWASVSNAILSPELTGALENELAAFDIRQAHFDVGIVPPPPPGDISTQERGEKPLEETVPDLRVDRDPVTKMPRYVRSATELLSKPRPSEPETVVKDFVTAHPSLFALETSDFEPQNCTVGCDNAVASGRFTHVRFRQHIDGVGVDGGDLRGNVTAKGEVINISGSFVPQARAARNASAPSYSADQAVVRAAGYIGAAMITAPPRLSGPTGAAQASVYASSQGLARGAKARLLYFPFSREQVRLAWEVQLRRTSSPNLYRVVVDAVSGEVLQRVNLTAYAASQSITLNVFTSDSPSPFSPGSSTPDGFQPAVVSRTPLTFISLNPTASPNGWINDGDNTTSGNNVIADTDLDLDFEHELPLPAGSSFRVFDFPLNLALQPSTYSDAASVNLFYWCNFAHDKLYELGFDELSGNFQLDNFGRGGLGNDRLIALSQAGANVAFKNNAFYLPAPDGESPFIAMFLWDGPSPERDGSLDAEIILHEYVHGLSTRLAGVNGTITALQSRGLGEGWSDFYALALLSETGDDVNGSYPVGGYATFNLLTGFDDNYYFGIRRYPYSTDLSKNPLTFQDIDPTKISLPPSVPINPIFEGTAADEVHNQGEVWCIALWECRALLIETHGFAGNQIMLRLVTDGMKLGPPNPTFLQARDAIIQADVINNDGANVCNLWKGFAKRGMGFSATGPNASTAVGVAEAFDIPVDCTVFIREVIVDDTTGGNGNGFVESTETISLKVVIERPGSLTNTLTGITAVLSTTTPGITITQANSTYTNIAAGGSATNVTPYVFHVASNVLCGSQINLLLDVNSNDGQFRLPFLLDVGKPLVLFSLDFEGGSGGLVVDNTANGLWHLTSGRGSQGGHTKTNSMYYGKDENPGGGGNYNTGTPNRGSFTLPPINLLGINGTVLLTFNHFLQREKAAPRNYDVARVELSRNGGASFFTVGGPYVTTTNRFQRATVDLTPFLNREVILRFSFDTVDHQFNDFEGWYVDDIEVRAFDCPLALRASGEIIAQGISLSSRNALFTVFSGVGGTSLLSQGVLTNAPHGDFRSFPADTAGNQVNSVVVAGVRDTGVIDFEVRSGVTGDELGSGSLSGSLFAPYQAMAAQVDGSAAEELIFVASSNNGPVLDIRDGATGDSIRSTAVLGADGYTDLALVAADVDGDGRKEIAVIGRRMRDRRVEVDVRSGVTGERLAIFALKKSLAAPLAALAVDTDGSGTEKIAILASNKKGQAVLALLDGHRGKKLAQKRVLKRASENPLLSVGRVLSGAGRQLVLLGSNAHTGDVTAEVYAKRGKRVRSVALNSQVGGPLDAVMGDVNNDGRDEIVLSARRGATNVPILVVLDGNSGGSLYIVNSFESKTVSNVRVFIADVDGDGIGDVVTSATRDSDGVLLFEVRAGVSGLLFSSFDQGTDFAGPHRAFGAHVGD